MAIAGVEKNHYLRAFHLDDHARPERGAPSVMVEVLDLDSLPDEILHQSQRLKGLGIGKSRGLT